MSESDGKKLNGRLRSAIALCVVVALLSLLLVLWYFLAGVYAVSLDLEEYTTIGRDVSGRVTATVDVDAILRDYGLPNPARVEVQLDRYADVVALCTMQVSASYAPSEGFLHIAVVADSAALLKGGIRLLRTEWDQPLPQADTEYTEQSPVETLPTATDAPVMQEGILDSLLDKDWNGLNLRNVCERVQTERDLAAVREFGEEYSTVKISIVFLTNMGGSNPNNVYRAVYRITDKAEDGQTSESVYLTVDVIGLKWAAMTGVTFSAVETMVYRSQMEATELGEYQGYALTKLSGGGVMVEDKKTFDQNGFVRFADQPTSFSLANGVYWSPTYDLLTEDMVWKLTATEERSLINLLRYARREIYARHDLSFDETAEKEFYDFYHRYDWYTGGNADVEGLLTENEKANIRLLREIQSLLED